MQLIKLFPHFDNMVNVRNQVVIRALHAIVHVSEDEVEVRYDIGINFLSLDSHFAYQLAHHFVAL